uniref:DUF3668 domain-containing protein n=1 Tax=Clastoptera arizonana TaxID=38151 RepID=A0A1B6CTJ9_9HEMI
MKLAKKLVRRLRVENTSVKIDCYKIANGRKDRIGYILVNLKLFQIISPKMQVTEAWHKLLGVKRDAGVLCPQLLMSFYLTSIPDDDTLPLKLQTNPPKWKESHDSQTIIAFIKEDENVIQIGPEKPPMSNFCLELSISAAYNIVQLLPTTDNHEKSKLKVIYSILGLRVNTKPVTTSDSIFIFNEKVSVRLISNMNYLSELIEPIKVDLYLMLDDKEIGTTVFFLENLTNLLKETIEQKCFLVSQNLDLNLSDQEKPYFEVAVCFNKQSMPTKKTMDLSTIKTHKKNKDKPKSYNMQEISLSDRKGQTNSLPSVKLNLDSVDKRSSKTAPGGFTYRSKKDFGPLCTYTLTVVINSIQLNEIHSECKKVEFKFHHPEAIIKLFSNPVVDVSDAIEMIEIPPVQANFLFKLPENFYQSVLIAQPPSVTVSSEGKDIASTPLDLGIVFCQDQKKCSFTAVLEEDNCKKGMLGVDMAFYVPVDQVVVASERVTEQLNVQTPRLDDQVMLKIVEELEDWKEKQQEIFKDELIKKEREHLLKISDEWESKKQYLENSLIFNVENSQRVLDSLNTAMENLKMRELKLQEKEFELQKEKQELEKNLASKSQELRLASQRMRDDQVIKTSKAVMEKVNELEEKVNLLEKERNSLEKIVKKYEQDQIQSAELLSKEQTAALKSELEKVVELLEKEKESKLFYKTEWGKSVRELRKLKNMYGEAIKSQMEKANKELQLLSIQQITSQHDKALQEDQMKLHQLKSEVLSWTKGLGDGFHIDSVRTFRSNNEGIDTN